MSFMMMKKKKYKFQVDFLLESLTSVPFVNGILFAKIRLNDGRKFTDTSQRVEVQDHCVQWNNKFSFTFKTSANLCTGVLESCPCRISVRKEVKGGRSHLKVGYVDVDLCQFAGAGVTTRRYLLEGYDARHRQDNSILCITLAVNLVSGDPCFKVPTSSQPTLLPEETKSHSEEYLSTGSLASRSSGFGSLPRHPTLPIGAPASITASSVEVAGDDATTLGAATSSGGSSSREDLEPLSTAIAMPKPVSSSEFELSHSRNSSCVSGYGSLHSRQNSSESGHLRNLSATSSGFVELGGSLKERKRPLTKKPVSEESRVDSTRVNVGQLIDELFKSTNFPEAATEGEGEESSGLRLIINKDGTAALATHSQPP